MTIKHPCGCLTRFAFRVGTHASFSLVKIRAIPYNVCMEI